MNENRFRSEMRRAETMRKLAESPSSSDYWRGYIYGLRRLYHGERFGTLKEHEQRLNFLNSDYEDRKNFGAGYRDGLAADELNKRGRPPVGGEILDRLTVPPELKNQLEIVAAKNNLSMTDARRAAYKKFVTPDYCTQNDGDCMTCSLVNYNRDCRNNSLAERGFVV